METRPGERGGPTEQSLLERDTLALGASPPLPRPGLGCHGLGMTSLEDRAGTVESGCRERAPCFTNAPGLFLEPLRFPFLCLLPHPAPILTPKPGAVARVAYRAPKSPSCSQVGIAPGAGTVGNKHRASL